MTYVQLLCVFLLPIFLEAIPGTYKSLNEFENIIFPYSKSQIYKERETSCQSECVKDEFCKAYAVSYFHEECQMFNQTKNFDEPINLEYTLYIRLEDSSDGYHLIGKNYYRLETKRASAYKAAQNCKSDYSGKLAYDRNQEIHDLMIKLMTYHDIYRAWISVNDIDKEGVWVDADGKEIGKSWWQESGYWTSYRRNCVRIRRGEGAEWKHQDCGNPLYYFCEIPLFLE